MIVTDIGDFCTECHQSTAWGSGKFVNRIPSDNGFEQGWMCEECQMLECNRCGESTLDYWYVDNGEAVETVCEECIAEWEKS